MARRARKGFTLIELLVVIAIIAILAAILFPVLAAARERGRQAKCLNNLKHLAAAVRLYADDNDGRVPNVSINGDYGDASNRDWCGTEWVGGPLYVEKGSLYYYTRSRTLYLCPTDAGVIAPYVVIPMALRQEFDADSQGRPRRYPLSYGMNGEMRGYIKLDSAPRVRLSRMLLFIQERRKTINDGLFLWRKAGTALNTHDLPDQIHFSGTSVVYCDGHARWASKEDLLRQMREGEWSIDGWRPG